MAEVTIKVLENGPYMVEGDVSLSDADGAAHTARPKMYLCRCGASVNKPFCDGTHSKIGFEAAERAVAEGS